MNTTHVSVAGLWRYRQLVRQLAARELKARYKVSVLGFFWSLLRPLLTIAVLAAVFSLLDFRSSRYEVSYPTFLLVSYLPWFFFATALLEGTQSLLANAHLIKKVYSPREVYPASITASNLINFFLSLAVLLPVVYGILHVRPSWALLQLPAIVLVQASLLLGLCCLTSVLNVLYRDTGQIVEFGVFVWFYITPVLYDVAEVYHKLPRWGWTVYFLNPMAGIVEWYRYAFLAAHLRTTDGSGDAAAIMPFLYYEAIPYSAAVSLLALWGGYVLLKRLETRAVDSL